MAGPSFPEDKAKKENILSIKCQFLLWSCVLTPISIIIGTIVVIILIRYQSSFSSINIKYDIGTTPVLERTTKTTQMQIISTEGNNKIVSDVNKNICLVTTSISRNISNTNSSRIPCSSLKFSSYASYSAKSGVQSISTGYLDADSFLDIVVVNRGAGSIGIYYGSANGKFQNAKIISTTSYVMYVAIKDMNNDNKSDILLIDGILNELVILINKGNQIFNSAITYPVGNYPYWIDTGDFNKNNLTDVVVVNDQDATVTVLYDYYNLTFSYSKIYLVGNDVTAVSGADFN
ncbi:unnamed protein product, partial [Adineta steineri]